MDPQFVRVTYFGLAEGALLALIALGLVLIFKSTDVINFAHGQFMMLGAYVMLQVMEWFEPIHTDIIQVSPWSDPLLGSWVIGDAVLIMISAIVTVLILMLVAVVVERLVLRPMIGEPIIAVIMITIGLGSIVEAVIGALWTFQPQRFPINIVPREFAEIVFSESSKQRLPLDRTFTAIIVIILITLLIIFFRRSRHGIAMRAAADDQQAAMSMGISISVVFRLAWSFGIMTAGIVGILIANQGGVGRPIEATVFRAFPVIILGGLDSIPGAIIGGIAIGLIEQYSFTYLLPLIDGAAFDTSFIRIFATKEVIPYVVLIAVLMVKPYGLFGQERIERV